MNHRGVKSTDHQELAGLPFVGRRGGAVRAERREFLQRAVVLQFIFLIFSPEKAEHHAGGR